MALKRCSGCRNFKDLKEYLSCDDCRKAQINNREIQREKNNKLLDCYLCVKFNCERISKGIHASKSGKLYCGTHINVCEKHENAEEEGKILCDGHNHGGCTNVLGIDDEETKCDECRTKERKKNKRVDEKRRAKKE